MHIARFDARPAVLRRCERRAIQILRALSDPAGLQDDLADDLINSLGQPRAGHCLAGFADLVALMSRHGWRAFDICAPGTTGYTNDEIALAQFIFDATEQRRDKALIDASFLVVPKGLLPLLTAAPRAGLPLLCEECRARVKGRV